MKKLFNINKIIKKLFSKDIDKILKRSQLYDGLDFADTFLKSTK